jgi:hypothetical protein
MAHLWLASLPFLVIRERPRLDLFQRFGGCLADSQEAVFLRQPGKPGHRRLGRWANAAQDPGGPLAQAGASLH